MALYDSVLDTIGNTPIVRLQRIAPKHVTLYAKVESFNPGGSVKDRPAYSMVRRAEERGGRSRRSAAISPGSAGRVSAIGRDYCCAAGSACAVAASGFGCGASGATAKPC